MYFVGEYEEDDEADLLLKTSSNDIPGEYLDCTSLYHYETTEKRKHSSNMRTACFCGSGGGGMMSLLAWLHVPSGGTASWEGVWV